MSDTIFGKMISGEISAPKVYEDEYCICINDIAPQAPTHVLIIPKKPLQKIADAQAEDQTLLGHLMLTAGHVARQLGVADAFRLIVNNGQEAGQTVMHLHVHLLAGKTFEEGMV